MHELYSLYEYPICTTYRIYEVRKQVFNYSYNESDKSKKRY